MMLHIFFTCHLQMRLRLELVERLPSPTIPPSTAQCQGMPSGCRIPTRLLLRRIENSSESDRASYHSQRRWQDSFGSLDPPRLCLCWTDANNNDSIVQQPLRCARTTCDIVPSPSFPSGLSAFVHVGTCFCIASWCELQASLSEQECNIARLSSIGTRCLTLHFVYSRGYLCIHDSHSHQEKINQGPTELDKRVGRKEQESPAPFASLHYG